MARRASWKEEVFQEFTNYPMSVLHFPNGNNKSLHPNQKPVALFEYLIRTYTQPGELVLDPCVGSGTTALAARNTGRHYICGDSSAEYVAIARARLAEPYTPPMFAEEPTDQPSVPVSADGLEVFHQMILSS